MPLQRKGWEGRERLYAYNQLNRLMKRDLPEEERPQGRLDPAHWPLSGTLSGFTQAMKAAPRPKKRPQARDPVMDHWALNGNVPGLVKALASLKAVRALQAAEPLPKKRAEDAPCQGHETSWFDGARKPTHTGLYHRKIVMEGRSWLWSYWNGTEWMIGAATPEDALRKGIASKHQFVPWRGCLIPPEPAEQRAPRRGHLSRKAHRKARR